MLLNDFFSLVRVCVSTTHDHGRHKNTNNFNQLPNSRSQTRKSLCSCECVSFGFNFFVQFPFAWKHGEAEETLLSWKKKSSQSESNLDTIHTHTHTRHDVHMWPFAETSFSFSASLSLSLSLRLLLFVEWAHDFSMGIQVRSEKHNKNVMKLGWDARRYSRFISILAVRLIGILCPLKVQFFLCIGLMRLSFSANRQLFGGPSSTFIHVIASNSSSMRSNCLLSNVDWIECDTKSSIVSQFHSYMHPYVVRSAQLSMATETEEKSYFIALEREECEDLGNELSRAHSPIPWKRYHLKRPCPFILLLRIPTHASTANVCVCETNQDSVYEHLRCDQIYLFIFLSFLSVGVCCWLLLFWLWIMRNAKECARERKSEETLDTRRHDICVYGTLKCWKLATLSSSSSNDVMISSNSAEYDSLFPEFHSTQSTHTHARVCVCARKNEKWIEWNDRRVRELNDDDDHWRPKVRTLFIFCMI